jgi:DNA-binding CsgD family transcriptional regulator
LAKLGAPIRREAANYPGISLEREYRPPMSAEERARRHRVISKMWLTGDTMKEIAAEIGMSEGSVATAIGRVNLRGHCKRFGYARTVHWLPQVS